MNFDTKKMIIATIIVGILFVLFLGYAFNSIQKVDFAVEILDETVNEELQNVANTIIKKYNVEYVDNKSLEDINMDFLLVNHQSKTACIIKDKVTYAVNYESLDKSIVYCNSFLVTLDAKKTIIINYDEILGNTTAGAIANAYHYEFASSANLSPENVEHFQTINQDEIVSFYKYAMIESLKNAYFGDEKLDEFYYFYDQWTYYDGMNHYQEVINYDYYDGLKAFVYAKVMADIDESFNIEKHLNSYKNEFGIYSKDVENEIMGMLWCMLMEHQGKEILIDDDSTKDMYKILLEGTPQGYVDDEILKSDYSKAFAEYIEFIEHTINEYKKDVDTVSDVSPTITAETYSGTIKVEDNYYVYIDYIARDNDNELLEQDYVLAEIAPYTIKFFFR